MSVSKEDDVYTGLSTDAKPTATQGEIYHELDTSKEYVFNGSSWVSYSRPVTVVGSLAKEPFGGSATYTKTFTQTMNGFAISNDGASSLTFTIGTDTYTVLAGEVLSLAFAPFTVVTVTTTVAYRAWGLM